MESKNDKIIIRINYKKKGHPEWSTKVLLPEEYFDTTIDTEFHIDSVPLWMHAAEYITEPIKKITCTELVLVDKTNEKKIVTKETFWNNAKNRLIETIEYVSGEVSYWEVIIQTEISEKPNTIQTLRYTRQTNENHISLHNIRTIDDTGSEIVEYFKPKREKRKIT